MNAATQPADGRKALPHGHYRFSGLLRSEWTKLRTVRSTMWTLAITVVLGIGLSALLTAITRDHWAAMSLSDRASFDATQTSLVGLIFGQFTIGVLGVLILSAEYGTGTIRATFAAAPRRPGVLAAKALVFGTVSLLVAEAVAFAAYLLGQALLTSPATHTTLASPAALRAVVASGLYLCVLGLLALGLAAIIRHTAGAITAFAGILLVLPLIIGALPNSVANAVNRFLPAQIGQSLVSLHSAPHAFSPWYGFLLLCGYAAIALMTGGILLVRRDT